MGSSSDVEILPPSPTKSTSRDKSTSLSVPPQSATTNNSSKPPTSSRPRARRIGVKLNKDDSLTSVKEGSVGLKAGDNSQGSSNGSFRNSAKSKGKGKESEVVVVDDESEEDAFFTKRSVVAAPAKRKFGANKNKQPLPLPSSSSSSSNSDDAGSPGDKRSNYKKLKLPDWTQRASTQSNAMKRAIAIGKPNRAKRRLSVDSSADEGKPSEFAYNASDKKNALVIASESDEDSDDSLLFEDDDSKKKKNEKGKGKEKEREKSRSLTPPAPLGAFLIAQQMQTLRDNLGPERSTRALPSNYNLNSSPANGAKRKIFSSDNENDKEDGLESEEDESNKVLINVITIFDPTTINPSLRAIAAFQTPRPFRVSSNSSFSPMFKSLAALLSVSDRTTLVVTFNGRRVYDFGTPSSLKIRTEGTFKCYTAEIWAASEKIRLNPVEEPELDSTSDITGNNDTSHAQATSRETSTQPTTADSVDLLKITVRSATSSLPLAVKKTMLVSQLLKQYCKKFNVDEKRMSSMWLEFDGEKLDMSKMLKDYEDIEDEENVDVREAKS